MADAAAAAAVALGGHGRAHFALHVNASEFSFVGGDAGYGRPIPPSHALSPIRRWTDEVAVTDDILESVKRELLRACGIRAWEPC